MTKLRSAATAICLGLMLAFVRVPSCDAQSLSDGTDADWDFRYELFQALLEQQGLETVTTATVPMQDPSRSVVIAVGQIDSITAEYVQHFCGSGGALLLACDSQHFLGSMCSFRAGAAVTFDEDLKYQGHADCIRITNVNSDHPLMAGVGSIIVNRSGWLARHRWPKFKLNVAASLPSACTPTVSKNSPMLATVEGLSTNNGRLIVCADQSLLTNGMLWHGDNSLLAINIVEYLTANQKRDRVYFLDGGRPMKSFRNSPMVDANAIPPKPDSAELPKPGLETFLQLSNAVLKDVENSNVMNEALANQPRGMMPSRYRRATMFVLGFLVVAFIIWHLCSNSPNPPESMPVRQMQTAYAMQADRKVKSSEFGSAANMLARDLCRELTDSGDSAVWLRELRPGVMQPNSILMETSNQMALTTVVDLAVNSQTVHISQKRFAAIGQTIQELRRLHRSGQLIQTTT